MNTVVAALRTQLHDNVFEYGDDEYAVATSPDNCSFSQHPRAVVRPSSPDQLAQTVKCAAAFGATIVVQSTGHGAGRPIIGDKILLDTSAMNAVAINPSTRTAQAGAGARWRAVQEAAWQHGLLGLSGTSPTVGVPGYIFGGGVGWLTRKHGLASAALRSVDYVDGTGRLRHASEDAIDPVDREALWAFRGGGGIGIATSVEIDLFPIADLWTGYLLWPAAALPDVADAWTRALESVTESVTSSLSLLHLPPVVPFPEELLGAPVVHLSYASPDGRGGLDAMRDALHRAATPIVDTTGPGDTASLSAIHLDPPSAVPGRGTGRWLSAAAAGVIEAMFDAARVGKPDGLNMIELRHTATQVTGVDGALATVPAPFLLHAVAAAADDGARIHADMTLRQLETASHAAAIGRSAPSFCDGQPEIADAFSPAEVARLQEVRASLDPAHLFAVQRNSTI